jgi:hypothetical protein
MQKRQYSLQATDIAQLGSNFGATIQNLRNLQSKIKQIAQGASEAISEAHHKLDLASSVRRKMSSREFDTSLIEQSGHILQCLDVLVDQNQMDLALWCDGNKTQRSLGRLQARRNDLRIAFGREATIASPSKAAVMEIFRKL